MPEPKAIDNPITAAMMAGITESLSGHVVELTDDMMATGIGLPLCGEILKLVNRRLIRIADGQPMDAGEHIPVPKDVEILILRFAAIGVGVVVNQLVNTHSAESLK